MALAFNLENISDSTVAFFARQMRIGYRKNKLHTKDFLHLNCTCVLMKRDQYINQLQSLLLNIRYLPTAKATREIRAEKLVSMSAAAVNWQVVGSSMLRR